MNTNLAKLLKNNRRKIIELWVQALQRHIADYALRPKKELNETTNKHLDGIISVLEQDDYNTLRTFARNIAPIRFKHRFSLSQTLRAFTYGKKIIHDIIYTEYKTNSSVLILALHNLDETFNQALFYYVDFYQDIQIGELQKQFRMLAKAEEEHKFLTEISAEKEKLDLIIEAIGADIALIDKNRNVIWSKEALTSDFKKLRQKVSSFCDICSWYDVTEKRKCPTLRCFETGKPENEVVEVISNNILKHSFQITVLPVTKNGKVEHVLEIIRDVTDWWNLQREFNANKELFSAVIDSSDDAIIGLNQNKTIVLWNKGAEKMFNYVPEEILYQPFEKLLPLHLLRNGEIDWLFQQIKEKGAIKNYETVCLQKNKGNVLVELTCTPVRNMFNEQIGYSLVIRNITEKKRLEEKVLQAERLATVGHLAAKISHEIRNPLSSISLNTELLEDELENLDKDKVQEARNLLKAISSEVDRLTMLTNEYLQYSRLQNPEYENIDVNELLHDLITFCKPEFIKNNVQVMVNFYPRLPQIALDKEKIRRVLLNLFRNAIEAMPVGGSINLKTQPKGTGIAIIITDTGTGIAEKDLANIFTPFFTTKKVGTGLGLSIARQIIEAHQGTITCSSTKNEGTTFEILLPMVVTTSGEPI